ncbi:MAG: hypothetical protein LDLANPLL_00084 [Turneriella sp.]|nr:hypothetical protein [Turneriella sp.]
MPAALDDFDRRVSHTIHQTMFVVNSTRPATSKISFQRFGFTDTLKRITLDMLNEIDNFLCNALIFANPIRQIVHGARFEGRTPIHLPSSTYFCNSSIVNEITLPAFKSTIDCSSRSRFFGDDNKNSVSSIAPPSTRTVISWLGNSLFIPSTKFISNSLLFNRIVAIACSAVMAVIYPPAIRYGNKKVR